MVFGQITDKLARMRSNDESPSSPHATASPHQKSGRSGRCLNGCRAHLPGSTNLMPPCLLVGGAPSSAYPPADFRGMQQTSS
jgi:hypothetical protein